MAAVTKKQYGVGMRHAVIYELNSNGSPAATDTSPYAGSQIVGAKTFTMTIPDARKITHVGDDRPIQVDYLPPNEASSGELMFAQEDHDIYATLMGNNVLTVGEASLVGLGSSAQGSEPQVGLLMYQQSLDSTGARNYRFVLIPKATLYVRPSGLNDNASEHSATVSPAVVSEHLWETAFTAGVEGFTDAQILVGQSKYKPALVAWLCGVSDTLFAMPTSTPAADTAKMTVWVDGVEQTSGVTKSTNSIEFTTSPGSNARIVCFYEHS